MDIFGKFLVNRITQLAVRGLTLVCAFLFGQDAVKGDDAGAAISSGASWLLLMLGGFLFDLVMHSAQWGKLKTWWANYTARTLAILVVAGTALAFLPGLAGCAANETNRVSQSVVLTKQAADTALLLHNTGVTTPAQEARIDELLKACAAAEDAYYASIRAGDPDALKAAKASWAAASAVLAEEIAKYPVPVRPSTRPATRP